MGFLGLEPPRYEFVMNLALFQIDEPRCAGGTGASEFGNKGWLARKALFLGSNPTHDPQIVVQSVVHYPHSPPTDRSRKANITGELSGFPFPTCKRPCVCLFTIVSVLKVLSSD